MLRDERARYRPAPERSAGIEVSPDTVSRITDGCLEEMRAWQSRLEQSTRSCSWMRWSPRSGRRQRAEQAVNIAVGVDYKGIKHVLGIWVSAAEGAKTWRRRWRRCATGPGGCDLLLLRRAGGLARRSPRPRGRHRQTCVVHLIRRPAGTAPIPTARPGAAMRPVYTAPDMDAAEAALLESPTARWGGRPGRGQRWERAGTGSSRSWIEPPIRKVIYTTNTIEAFNRQSGKSSRPAATSPMRALVKLLWLVSSTSRTSAPRRAAPRHGRQAARQAQRAGHLIEGSVTQAGGRPGRVDKRWPGRIPAGAI